MTQPEHSPPVLDGTDISADPQDLDSPPDDAHRPVTSDPEALTDEGALGGAGGQGGAG